MVGILGQQAPPPASILGQQWWPQQNILGGAQSAPPQGSLWDDLMSMFRRRGEQLAAHPTPAFDAMVNAPVERIGQLDDAVRGRWGMTQDDMVGFGADMGGLATTGSLMAPAVRGGVGMGIKAYHGSPHDFDAFSMDKIGTGEGAQVYGHGLYFAENEGVARSYKDALAAQGVKVKPGANWEPTELGIANRIAQQYPGDLEGAISALEMQASLYARRQETGMVRSIEGAVDKLRNGDFQFENPGRTYEVSIDASPDEFLDWDKPLSEQPPKVREAVESLLPGEEDLQEMYGSTVADLLRGSEYDVQMGPRAARPPSHASEQLRAAGIKGIRYKDAGSRQPGVLIDGKPEAKGPKEWPTELATEILKMRGSPEAAIKALEPHVPTGDAYAMAAKEAISLLREGRVAFAPGSHNYVVFDDKTISILKKYGLAGLTGGGAALAAQGPDEPVY